MALKTRKKKEKRERDAAIISEMVAIYCRHKHGGKDGKEAMGLPHGADDGLCEECRELREYALLRLEHCRFGDSKPTCRRCPVHCYKPQMRERISMVMRYSWRWMLIYHPLQSVKHLF